MKDPSGGGNRSQSLLEEVSLEGAEKLFGLGQAYPEMFDAFVIRVEGDDIGDRVFVTVIVIDDELQFDARTGLLRVRVANE